MTSKATVAQPRRGRPKLKKPELSQVPTTTAGIAFSARVLRKGEEQGARSALTQMSVMDRIQALAARELGSADPKAVAKLARIAESSAQALILGTKPVTAKVLAAVVRSTGVSGHWILTGEGSMSSEPPSHEEEQQFIANMRLLDESRALLMDMGLGLMSVLLAVPENERLRCLAALNRAILAAQQDHRFLNSPIGDFVKELSKNVSQITFQWGLDVEQLETQRAMFTPLHEFAGAFGPEQESSLIALLSA